MLENLRQMNRLSDEEERQIDNKLLIFVAAVAAAVVIYIVWQLTHGGVVGKAYYAIILILLAVVWIMRDVVGTVWKHSLAQRTDAQVSAYLKAAGFDLISYVGLGVFLVMMQSNAIVGAIIYVIGVVGARKQREIYYDEPGDDEADVIDADASEDKVDADSDLSNRSVDSLPTAADREKREKDTEDGSV